jgi:adenine phosphoribosyltransferase
MNLKELIRTIPNFPKEGIMFRDITTLLKDPEGFAHTIHLMTERYKDWDIDYIVGIESRGFILGAALAHNLKKGFVPLRKPGKLPGETYSQEYTLEYGTDTLEIHVDALHKDDKVLLVDDLLATGGTAIGGISLIEKIGAKVEEFCVVIELPELGGRKKVEDLGHTIHAMLDFEGH